MYLFVCSLNTGDSVMIWLVADRAIVILVEQPATGELLMSVIAFKVYLPLISNKEVSGIWV